jgi:hypothetical protein
MKNKKVVLNLHSETVINKEKTCQDHNCHLLRKKNKKLLLRQLLVLKVLLDLLVQSLRGMDGPKEELQLLNKALESLEDLLEHSHLLLLNLKRMQTMGDGELPRSDLINY